MSGLLLPNEKALEKIDGIVSFGIRMAKRDWKKVVMYFTMSGKLTNKEQAMAIQQIMLLPNMTADNIEFDAEVKKTGKHISFENQYIRADKPRK